MRLSVLIVAAGLGSPALAGESPDPGLMLQCARARILEAVGRLPKYTCVQTVDRYYFKPERPPRRGCDDIVGDRAAGRTAANLVAADRLRLDVAVGEAGREIYSWVGAGRFESEDVWDIVGGGPIGTGSFGSFLIDIFAGGNASFVYTGDKPGDGIEYRFHVPVQRSHYQVRTRSGWRVTGYDGNFAIDPGNCELRRLRVRTSELPQESGACEAATSLRFARVAIGASDYLLPAEARLRVISRSGEESENVSRFTGCREFRGESVVRFEETEPGVAEGREEGDSAVPLPAGLPVTLALLAKIDTETAAAGDAIAARLVKDVRATGAQDGRPAGAILARAGATVRGRITKMEHNLEEQPYFLITLTFESIESAGLSRPFCATLNSRFANLWKVSSGRPATSAKVTSRTRFGPGGTFGFPAPDGRYVVPSGFESLWVTARPR